MRSPSHAKAHVQVIGTGTYLPDRVLTNYDLEKLVDTTDAWITTRTGIKERRVADKHQATSDLAVKAAHKALQDAKLSAEAVDLIIVATATPDMFFPSTACFVQKALGIKEAVSFDLSAACSGFLFALDAARRMLEEGPYKTALLIGAEKLSMITNWEDRSTCVLFGDGAGAAVLQRRPGSKGVLSTYVRSDATHTDILWVPGGGSRAPATAEVVAKKLNTIHMEGKEVFKLAVHKMISAIHEALRLAHKKDTDLALLIPHQANLRIIEAIAKRVHVPRERIFVNLQKYGNMSAATTIVALDEARREGRVREGDLVALVAFGAGLTWGAAVIQF
ncbi:MAG: 3-oxoacyl-ACP synthase [Elusimicrobia bacterium RIFCSPLOWO2_01_FULL_59_12]|nr:MAG: 3-oxoacyl-ACP synthase [Elusimicrobia bacterium RIFCSPLOWO2_01_FULL_59_12]